MTTQPNLTRRIFDCIKASGGAMSQRQITDALVEPEDDRTRLGTIVAALLLQQTQRKKLARTGARGAYLYRTTATTFTDLRKLPRELGKPRAQRATPKPATTIKAACAKAPKPAPKATAAAKPTTRTLTQRLAVANLRPAAPRKPGERETVAEFLARGGRIQKLRHGESSQPAYIDVRAVDDRAMRARLQKALDTEPANTSDADVAAA